MPSLNPQPLPALNGADPIHGGRHDTEFHTPQRVLLERAWKRALDAKKRLVIRVTAPWADECAMFDESLAKGGAELNKVLERVETLVLDDNEFERGHQADYLISDLMHLHTVYLVDPATKAWSVIPNVSDAGLLTRYITLWLDSTDFPATLQRLIKEFKPADAAQLPPLQHLVHTALQTTAYSRSYEETFAFFRQVRELAEKNKELFTGLDFAALEIKTVQTLINVGRITFEDVKSLNPELYARMAGVPEHLLEARLYNGVGVLVRKQGLRAAAEAAGALMEALHKELPTSMVTHEGVTIPTTGIRIKNESMVKILQARAGLITREQAVAFANEAEAAGVEFYFRDNIHQIFIALQDYEKAADLVEKALPEWIVFYDGLVAKMKAMGENFTAKGQPQMAQMLALKASVYGKVKERALKARHERAATLRQKIVCPSLKA
ncbi:hypothetical protein POL68_08740 [Stigmatella sp. ncwal1]|uniref:Uncharacterized protein n=1 Tax=Stigmatella ashevillensis TaxID=2995309 RepID=A0ABT5D4F5_9BACT|nr:hypothetical protein [Stigmatella ashevillena]MDC0708554.1 hypothetical protein [Stigmatella ashevillena]